MHNVVHVRNLTDLNGGFQFEKVETGATGENRNPLGLQLSQGVKGTGDGGHQFDAAVVKNEFFQVTG